MAEKPLPLRLYQGVNGPVAYDALGRTWPTSGEGDKVAPVVFTRAFVVVDKLAEPKSK